MTIKGEFIEKAVSYCCEKAKADAATIREWLVRGDSWTHSTFRYALAKGLGRYFAENSQDLVKEVYLYGSTMYDHANMHSDIDLIVCVRDRGLSAQSPSQSNGCSELLKLIESVDREVLNEYKSLVRNGVRRGFLVDAHVVGEDEVASRRGYGAVISSLETKPVRIWPSS